MPLNRRAAFTLIELLIVVAIIAILAAIAVPNFLEAQVRAKVSRTKADMRSMATALESYVVDHNHYPLGCVPVGSEDHVDPDYKTRNPRVRRLAPLTSPVAYMTNIPLDVFSHESNANYKVEDVRVYNYCDRESYMREVPDAASATNIVVGKQYSVLFVRQLPAATWILRSTGPITNFDNLGTSVDKRDSYDPTNGTVSLGNVIYVGGVGPLAGQGAN